MKANLVEQQEHGYRYGHELLASSVHLDRSDQDIIDRLSDMSGPLRPGETFEPYLTAYPLPSGKYYVLARTWQDHQAPRAGCVLTRSLLVPTATWEAAPAPADFVRLLLPIDREHGRAESRRVQPTHTVLPPVFERRAGELVEALFLENRQPMVMFETRHAELLSLRLLSALWPGLRRTFAICTFALSSRPLFETRPFDLLFAPKTARSRFSDWAGRKIEFGTSPPVRHRWTEATARQIFEAAEPSLVAIDALGVLKADRRGDETVLRLSLLWNELVEKSTSSPTAALGLLDILSSQGTAFEEVSNELTPLLERSIQMAGSSLAPMEAWTFLNALLGKFAQLLPPRTIIRHVKDAAFLLTMAEPETAIEFLSQRQDDSYLLPAVIAAGVGNGLATAGLSAISDSVSAVGDQTLLRVLAYSRKFSGLIARSVNALASDGWVRRIVRLLGTKDAVLRARMRRNLLPFLDNSAQAPLLQALLAHTTPASLTDAVVKIWSHTRFEVAAFDSAFLRAASGEATICAIRDAILCVEGTKEANRFLVSTLRLSVDELRWLLTQQRVPIARAVEVLTLLLEEADDASIQAISHQTAATDLVFDALRQGSNRAAVQIGRILLVGQTSVEQLIALGQEVLPFMSEPHRTEIANAMLLRGLSEGDTSSKERLREVIGSLPTNAYPNDVVLAATQGNAGWNRISENISMLCGTQGDLRLGVLARIEVLTDRLVSRRGDGLSRLAAESWATLLSEAGSVSRNAQTSAAMAVLPYAFRHTSEPLSSLVVAAFPIVYEQLKAGNEPAGLFQMLFFQDWDRCKTARRSLVQAFMQSSWPPGDLLLIAVRAGDPQRILRLVSREFNGNRYLSLIAEDLRRFPEDAGTELRAQLDVFGREARSFPERKS